MAFSSYFFRPLCARLLGWVHSWLSGGLLANQIPAFEISLGGLSAAGIRKIFGWDLFRPLEDGEFGTVSRGERLDLRCAAGIYIEEPCGR